MKLTEIVQPGSIVADLKVATRDEAISQLIDQLIESGAAPAAIRDEMIEKVLERERKHSTGFGRGVAVPHVKHNDINHITAAIGICQDGIDFSSLDGQPVYIVFLLLSPQSRPEEHLQAMEVIFKNLSKEHFRKDIQDAASAQQVYQYLDDADHHRIAGA